MSSRPSLNRRSRHNAWPSDAQHQLQRRQVVESSSSSSSSPSPSSLLNLSSRRQQKMMQHRHQTRRLQKPLPQKMNQKTLPKSPTSVMLPIAEVDEEEENLVATTKAKDDDDYDHNNNADDDSSVFDDDESSLVDDDDIDGYILTYDDDDDDDENTIIDDPDNESCVSSNVMSGLAAAEGGDSTDVHCGSAMSSSSEDVGDLRQNDEDQDDLLSEDFRAALDRRRNTEYGIDDHIRFETTFYASSLMGDGLSNFNVARFLSATNGPCSDSMSDDTTFAFKASNAGSAAPSDEISMYRISPPSLVPSTQSSNFRSKRFDENLLDRRVGSGSDNTSQPVWEDMTRTALTRAAEILERKQRRSHPCQRTDDSRGSTRRILRNKAQNQHVSPPSTLSDDDPDREEEEEDEATRFVRQRLHTLQVQIHASDSTFRRGVQSLLQDLKDKNDDIVALKTQLERAIAAREEKESELELAKIMREHEVEASDLQALHFKIALELMNIVDMNESSCNRGKQNDNEKQRRTEIMRAAGLTTMASRRNDSNTTSVARPIDRYNDLTVEELRVRKQRLDGIWKLIESAKLKELEVEFDSWAQSVEMKEDAVKKYLLMDKYNQI